MPRKIDKELESGEYFLSEEQKRQKAKVIYFYWCDKMLSKLLTQMQRKEAKKQAEDSDPDKSKKRRRYTWLKSAMNYLNTHTRQNFIGGQTKFGEKADEENEEQEKKAEKIEKVVLALEPSASERFKLIAALLSFACNFGVRDSTLRLERMKFSITWQ